MKTRLDWIRAFGRRTKNLKNFDPRFCYDYEQKIIDSLDPNDFEDYFNYLPQIWLLRPDRLQDAPSPIMVFNATKRRLCQFLRSLFDVQNRFVLICLLQACVALRSAAAQNQIEEEELMLEASYMEEVIVRIFQFRTLDDRRNVMSLLLPSLGSFNTRLEGYEFAANILQTEEFLGMCIRYNIKSPLACMAVLNVVATLQWGYSVKGKSSHILNRFELIHPPSKYAYELCCNPRSCPAFMLILEGLSKAAMLTLVCWVSVHVYAFHELSGYTGSYGERMLLVMVATSIAYEIGKFMDMYSKNTSVFLALAQYFNVIWNSLSFVYCLLTFLWAVMLRYPSQNMRGRIVLALSAIPLSFSIFQYLSINKLLGRLVIIIIAMTDDLVSFLVVYMVANLGFGMTLWALFRENKTLDYSTFGHVLMTLYATAQDGLDYDPFPDTSRAGYSIYAGHYPAYPLPNNDPVVEPTLGTDGHGYDAVHSSPHTEHEVYYTEELMVVGIVVYISFSALIGIVLMNLLIARMASTHDRLENKSKAEWAYLTVWMVAPLYCLDPIFSVYSPVLLWFLFILCLTIISFYD